MALYLVATPIGNPEDITLRAQKILAEASLIIGEEAKETRRILKEVGLSPREKTIELLNEHSSRKDHERLAELCREGTVALITDCGTPGFCDPGAELTALCRARGIEVHALPGASSLMVFFSLCGRRLDQFVFRGFLPAQTELRRPALQALAKEKRPVVLMDTPYRLGKLLDEVAQVLPQRKCILGVNLTQETERIFEGTAREIRSRLTEKKAEFMLLLEGQPSE